MKVCVYAIAKNEEHKVDEWFQRAKEADSVHVLVNNSTDNTAQKLRDLGADVKEIEYELFRFDRARNDSLELVPRDADACVCIDIDEIFEEGWRKKLEEKWRSKKPLHMLNYRLVFSSDEQTGEAIAWFPTPKIHSRHGWKWKYACHEALTWQRKTAFVKDYVDITAVHKQNTATNRANYLPLLKLNTEELPEDPRVWHYYGRELMFKGQYVEAITCLMKHLDISKWHEERCASMRFIARCHWYLGNIEQSKLWLFHACGEAKAREPYVDMAWLCYQLKDWFGVRFFAGIALSIDYRGAYPCEKLAWTDYPQKLYEAGDAACRLQYSTSEKSLDQQEQQVQLAQV